MDNVLHEKRNELRKRLSANLPDDLNTDFNLDRWLNSFEQDVNICEEKFLEYVKNRQALGLNSPEAISKFYACENVTRFHETFKVSRLDKEWINETDNGIVFVEMGIGDPQKVLKEFSIGEYLQAFFGYCEYFQHCIIEHEKRSGKRSHGVCIFDMSPMNFFHYANPYAPINRLLQARVNVWMNFYGELLKKIIIVNPPRLLGAVFKMMSVLLPEQMISRVVIAHALNDIEKHLSKNCIPKRYGGERLDYDMHIDKFSKNGSYLYCLNLKNLSENHGIRTKKCKEYNVLPHESFKETFNAKANQTMFIEYLANREIEVLLKNEDKQYLIPRFKLSTPVIPESHAILITQTGNIELEIKNLSTLMKMKLKISVHFYD